MRVDLGDWRRYWELFLPLRMDISAKQLWETRNSSRYYSMQKQLQEYSASECLQFPVESQGMASAHGEHTLKYIRGTTRFYCPMWKLHQFQKCRFGWEGVCSCEGEKNIVCVAPFFSSVNKRSRERKGLRNEKWLTNEVTPLQFWREYKGGWKQASFLAVCSIGFPVC